MTVLKYLLKQFKEELGNASGIDLQGEFDSAGSALAYAEEHVVDFALLDIRMPGMNGIALGEKLRVYYDRSYLHGNHHTFLPKQEYAKLPLCRRPYNLVYPYLRLPFFPYDI